MNLLLSHLLPKRAGIPVLMYHKVETNSNDSLTVSISDFKQQLAWLKNEGYQSISLQTFLEVLTGTKRKSELPKRPVLITFDDGYESTLLEASPLLKAQGLTATLFATSSYIEAGKEHGSTYLDVNGLKAWQSAGHDLALHSHAHPDYRSLDTVEIIQDLNTAQNWFKQNGITPTPVLAYPFGARPKEKSRIEALKQSLKTNGVIAAFRIGNKIANWSELERQKMDHYEIPRIDIRGDDTMESFAVKVQKGRVRPFQ